MRTKNLKEWIGKNDDAMPPTSIRLRILRTHNFTCHVTGLKITPRDKWSPDHVIALCNGGENRESNLRPVLRGKAHAEKTKADVQLRAHNDRKTKAAFGIKRRKRKMGYRKMNGTIVPPRWE